MQASRQTLDERLRFRVSSIGLSATAALAAFTVVAMGAFVTIALLRVQNLAPSAFDLAIFDQVIWGLANGIGFHTTYVPTNYDGEHISLVLLLFVPAYWLGAGPELLLVVQAIVVAGAAIPLYFAARAAGANERLALALSAAWLLNPYLHRALNFDFHPETMVALPAFCAVWAAARGHFRIAAFAAISCILFKEDAGLVGVAAGVAIWMYGGRREGALAATVASAYVIFAIGIWIPEARDHAPSHLFDRYGAVAGTSEPTEVVRALILHPWRPLLTLFEPPRLERLLVFFAVVAPLLVRKPWLALAAMPALAVPLLSAHYPQGRLELHYASNAIAATIVVGLAAIPAGRQTFPLLRTRHLPGWAAERAAATVVLAAAFAGFVALSPFAPWRFDPGETTAAHRSAVAEGLALIPRDAPVVAQSNLAPRVPPRLQMREFPWRPGEAHWVAVDRFGARSVQSVNAGFEDELTLVRAECERRFDRDGVEIFFCQGSEGS